MSASGDPRCWKHNWNPNEQVMKVNRFWYFWLTVLSVLGSQVFGTALMESCAFDINYFILFLWIEYHIILKWIWSMVLRWHMVDWAKHWYRLRPSHGLTKYEFKRVCQQFLCILYVAICFKKLEFFSKINTRMAKKLIC